MSALTPSSQSRATDPSLNISPPRAPECLSPAQDNEQPSLSLSELECEELEDEEEDSIPQHEFDVKITQGKFGKMKGVTRETVSLMIGNHIFRKRRQLKNGSVIFTCNGPPKTYLSAIARIIEDGTYQLVEWPRLKDHRCWADDVPYQNFMLDCQILHEYYENNYSFCLFFIGIIESIYIYVDYIYVALSSRVFH